MKRLNRLQSLVFLLPLLSACYYVSEPSHNDEFLYINELNEITGTYENRGDPSNSWPPYLTNIMWPDDSSMEHQNISHIEVRALDSYTLLVSAYQQGRVVKKQVFEAGKDFEFDGGSIVIDSGVKGYGNKSGEGVVALGYGKITLGLDKSGQGKYRAKEAGAGLIFLLIPYAGGGTSDVRFKRIR